VTRPGSAGLTVGRAAVLGVVQGATEFLPVSSSAHLLAVPRLLGWSAVLDDAALHRALASALHAGTALGALVVTGPDLLCGAADAAERRRLALLIVGGALPSAVAGALLADRVDASLGRPEQAAALLAAAGLLLGVVDATAPQRTPYEGLGPRHVAAMALAQALALAPGVSRAGATLTAGRAAGLDRVAANRASVVMGLPVTVGAAAYSLVTADRSGLVARCGPLLAGVAAAAVSGALALAGVTRAAERGRGSWPLAAYRCALAGLLVAAPRGQGERAWS
jgi:undecaprenyl-diphosphatase